MDLCPKPNETRNTLSKHSHAEAFEEHIPGLFSALLDDPDDEQWSVFTFPVDIDASIASQNPHILLRKLNPNITQSHMIIIM